MGTLSFSGCVAAGLNALLLRHHAFYPPNLPFDRPWPHFQTPFFFSETQIRRALLHPRQPDSRFVACRPESPRIGFFSKASSLFFCNIGPDCFVMIWNPIVDFKTPTLLLCPSFVLVKAVTNTHPPFAYSPLKWAQQWEQFFFCGMRGTSLLLLLSSQLDFSPLITPPRFFI